MSSDNGVLRFKQGETPPIGDWRGFAKKGVFQHLKMEEPFICESREGELRGEAGDWLAQDGYGGYYPIGSEYHDENFEEAP